MGWDEDRKVMGEGGRTREEGRKETPPILSPPSSSFPSLLDTILAGGNNTSGRKRIISPHVRWISCWTDGRLDGQGNGQEAATGTGGTNLVAVGLEADGS